MTNYSIRGDQARAASDASSSAAATATADVAFPSGSTSCRGLSDLASWNLFSRILSDLCVVLWGLSGCKEMQPERSASRRYGDVDRNRLVTSSVCLMVGASRSVKHRSSSQSLRRGAPPTTTFDGKTPAGAVGMPEEFALSADLGGVTCRHVRYVRG